MEDYAIGNNETEWETGKGEDNIKLSTKEVAFGFADGQVTVNAEGRHWWITEIVVDGERLFSMDVDKDAMKSRWKKQAISPLSTDGLPLKWRTGR